MNNFASSLPRSSRLWLAIVAVGASATAATAAAPAIRTSEYNKVPACVTPARLMHFLRDRNPKLDPRFDEIARWYKTHGDTWRVRWDYAFFQMIIETNHLSYRTGSGGWGDVRPKQNNFAGIGTTGGGVPGDGYPDVSTGVLAQIQHLVAYSGERMESPVAPRTQQRQDDIIAVSARLRRHVTFSDLAGRWAADRRYWRSIDSVAERFRAAHCNGHSPIPDEPLQAAAPKLVKPPTQVSLRQRTGLATADGSAPMTIAAIAPAISPSTALPSAAPQSCKVQSASFVGKSGARRTLLIQSQSGDEVHYTTLQVLDGFERSMAESFIKSRAPGGSLVATFDSHEAAVARTQELCPHG